MTARWLAVVTYRSDNGPIDVTHEIEELEEIQDLVEAGPDWNAIQDIRITLARSVYSGTLEQARVVGDMTQAQFEAWLAEGGRA